MNTSFMKPSNTDITIQMYTPDSASAALVAMVVLEDAAGLLPGVRTTGVLGAVDALIFPEGKEGSEGSSGSIWSSSGVETVVAIVA